LDKAKVDFVVALRNAKPALNPTVEFDEILARKW
jgi:hypothetical protein